MMPNTSPVNRTLDGEIVDPAPPPEKRRVPPIKLATLRDIKTELGRVYRLARIGEIEAHTATRLTFILKTIADLTATADLEARIQTLEALRHGDNK